MINALEIKYAMVFDLFSANNTILSCFFHFLLVINVNFLIPAVVKQIINSIAEDPIPAGIPTNKAKEKLKKTFNLK